jgi:hypothetical protein
VRFWGVRGSVPYATPGSIEHGCNTPCLEIVDERDERRLILDAGSGIVGVGETLTAVTDIPILLTHYHWDHIQGLPFFAPLYRAGAAITVWAPALGRKLADIQAIFEAPFFPVPYERLPSMPAIRLHADGHDRHQRIRRARSATEPSRRRVCLPHQGHDRRCRVRHGSRIRERRRRPRAGAFRVGRARARRRLALHPEELRTHKGWGHSDWSQCAQFAADCGAEIAVALSITNPDAPSAKVNGDPKAAAEGKFFPEYYVAAKERGWVLWLLAQ